MERLSDNVENIVASHKYLSENSKLESSLYDYISSEQALLFGHSFHPTPKSKGLYE